MSWGPWIEHDHSGVPVPFGTVVHRVFDVSVDMVNGARTLPFYEDIGPVRETEREVWEGGGEHTLGRIPRVIYYRVRRFDAQADLEALARTVRPVQAPEREPAE